MLHLSIQHSVIIQEFIQLDRKLFFWVNNDMVFPFLDQFALFMRNAKMHIPLYILLLYIAFKKFEKKAWWWLLAAALLIGFSDLLSSQLIKPFVGRLRPCRDPDISGQVRLLASYCGANGIFTSSHAVNHFAFANFTILTVGNGNKYYRWLYVWAALIAYSQVYVGVHFPSDVLAGAVLGIVLGWIGARFSPKPLTLRPQI